jgi:hypothetical protein
LLQVVSHLTYSVPTQLIAVRTMYLHDFEVFLLFCKNERQNDRWEVSTLVWNFHLLLYYFIIRNILCSRRLP